MNDSFLYPLKTLENKRFSDAFRVYRHGTLARDTLTKVERLILIAFIPFVVFRCTVVKMYGIFLLTTLVYLLLPLFMKVFWKETTENRDNDLQIQ